MLSEQVAYYRARATDYLDQARLVPGFDELTRALLTSRPTGNVLELACGPGTWTPLLLRTAATVTAVDAAPEMLDQARRQVGEAPVEFIQADLFSWRPRRTYDTVFFGFWLSHVPPARFDDFWRLVQESLAPRGSVFLMDDSQRTADEVRGDPLSATVTRRTADGDQHRLIKVAYTSADLQDRLAALGWCIEVHDVADELFWGSGRRAV